MKQLSKEYPVYKIDVKVRRRVCSMQSTPIRNFSTNPNPTDELSATVQVLATTFHLSSDGEVKRTGVSNKLIFGTVQLLRRKIKKLKNFFYQFLIKIRIFYNTKLEFVKFVSLSI